MSPARGSCGSRGCGYEQVRLAGSPLAGKVAENAPALPAGRVRQGLDLSLTSGALTLEMPAVQGETRLEVPYPYGPEDRLWQANPSDRRAVWQSLRQGDADGLLRRNVLLALIRRAAENPDRNLDRAAELVRLLDDPVRVVRPAEAHFLVMLQRDLAVRPMPEGLNATAREGLLVRLLAEEAALAVQGDGYAYSGRIRPWVAEAVAKADALRQKGEDLLFGSEPAQWAQALDLLKQAAAQYRQAQSDTAGLREGLAVCDRGLAELPAFAHWVAHIPEDANDELLNRTLSLFGEVRQLDQMVQDVVARREAGKVGEIRKRARAARAGLDLLQSRLDAFARTCETTTASPLRDGGLALRIPWLDAGARSRLLVKLGRLAMQERSESEANVEVSPGQLDEVSRRRAVREGRLALAALGPRWFDESRPGAMRYADVEPFLRRPDLEGVWSKVLRWAGDEVGARFRQYPVRVDQLVAEAKKEKQVAGPLREADRLQRHLDAGQWQVATTDAPVLARRADVETLLVWQGERTFTDHWYNDDPAAAPYYRITGIDYLRDARRIDPFGRADSPGAEVVRKRLEGPDGLSIVPSPARRMIAGDRLTLTAGLAAKPGSDVAGYPVMWAVPGDRLTFGRLQDAGRAAIPALGDQLAVSLTSPELERAEQSPPLEATAERSDVVWRAYYRGQKPTQTTQVSLYPVAESTRNDYPPPPRAGVAVRATDPLFTRFGRAQGGLVIVVDCSGSEGPATGAAATRTRFRQSLRALRTVLGRVPRGTRLSLWVFGQAVPPRNTVERAEETIQQLRAPAIWNADAGDVDALAGQVEALEPWNESPIARAVLRAREDLLKVEGFRDMIVLTDGADNRFARDTEANPKKEPIPEVLRRRFAGTNVAIHVVGFAGADGQPEPDLLNNFGFVTTRLPKGTVSTVTNLTPVLDAMKFTMPSGLRYRLAGTGDETSSGDVEVSRGDENDRWTLVTGGSEGYQLNVPLLKFDRPLTLRRGDFVLLDLDESDGGWRRLLWSKLDAFRLRPARQAGGWRVAVLQDQVLGERALQMLVSVEKESPRTADPGQVWPGAVWLEVSPSGSKANPAVRWGKLYGYPAPAWGIDVPGWPIGDQQGAPSPNLGAWWGTPGPAATLTLGRLDELIGPKRIGEERFTIDRAGVEEHWVQVRPGVREKRWCVVVGVAHDLDRPVWAALDGLTGLAGQEHRHFRAAGRYVGLFWFTDAATEEEVLRKAGAELTAVRLVSVTAFKAEAASALETAAFTSLDSPAALPPRPRPVARRTSCQLVRSKRTSWQLVLRGGDR
ncbi:MAG: vWA domain-containing protein [Gemmataceae bacterium]